jgi:LacI family transcriptional regulator
MKKKASLADIANSLGVSKTLVSLVLNGKADQYGISRETRERVRAKIRELDYQPDALARIFRTGKTLTIGLVVSDISNAFYSAIARHIEDLAWAHGYSLVICSTDENPEKEETQIRLLRERRTDGLIVSSSREGPEPFHELVKEGYPHVLIDRVFQDLQSPSVSADNFWGASLAATHLLEQGMREIGLVTVAPAHISTLRDRRQGFVSTLSAVGLEIPQEWIIEVPFRNTGQAIEDALRNLAGAGRMPKALFTLNNRLTADCLLSLKKGKMKIPGDVALIGFDDMPWFTQTNPSVSAIAQPVMEMAEQAFHMLLGQLKSSETMVAARPVHLPVELIARESSIINASRQHINV